MRKNCPTSSLQPAALGHGSRRPVGELRRYHPGQRQFLQPGDPHRRTPGQIASGFDHRNEIGIRIALGAERGRVLRKVLGEAAILLVTGLDATSATRLLASFLYRLGPNDPATLIAACAVLAMSAVIAGLLPARRAANLDPMTALREE